MVVEIISFLNKINKNYIISFGYTLILQFQLFMYFKTLTIYITKFLYLIILKVPFVQS